MTKIVTYPRGFLGYDIGLEPRVKGGSADSMIKAIKLNKQVPVKPRTFVSNDQVEEIWTQFKNGDKFLNSATFRKKVLVTALKAFGTDSFYTWCMLQHENENATEMQKRFINDTLTFIETGKRSLSIFSWIRLVASSDTNVSVGNPVVIRVAEYFRTDQPIQFRNTPLLTDCLVRWLSQKNGYEDLISTLHVLFGDSEIT